MTVPALFVLLIATLFIARAIGLIRSESDRQAELRQARDRRTSAVGELERAFEAVDGQDDPEKRTAVERAFSGALQAEIDVRESRSAARPVGWLLLIAGIFCVSVVAASAVSSGTEKQQRPKAEAIATTEVDTSVEIAPAAEPAVEFGSVRSAAWGHDVPSPLLEVVARVGHVEPIAAADRLRKLADEFSDLDAGHVRTEAVLAAFHAQSCVVRAAIETGEEGVRSLVPSSTREFVAQVRAETPEWAFRL